MKKTYLFLVQALLALSLIFAIGCSKDDPSTDPEKPIVTDPGTPVADPTGTITANISTGTSIDIPNNGNIRWTGPDNFNLYVYNNPYLVSICDMGTMQGLGNITNIPQTGFTVPTSSNTTVACEEGHGYVIKFERQGSASLYVRLYDVESIISTSGGVMGAKVKYQFPFTPTTLTLSKDSLLFTKDAGTQTLTITTNASAWTYTCSDSWISATKSGNTLSVSVPANTGLLRSGSITIQANENSKDIKVNQAMASTSAPYSIGDLYYENSVLGVVYKIATGGTHGMIVSMNETQCAWSTVYETTGCSDLTNGMNNMTSIKKISGWENKYPAFKWCNDFNTGNVSWYLPAQIELNDLYTNYTKVNTTLMYCGVVQIAADYYWSSSEDGNSGAWCQGFSTGSQSTNGKSYTSRVRAVRAF